MLSRKVTILFAVFSTLILSGTLCTAMVSKNSPAQYSVQITTIPELRPTATPVQTEALDRCDEDVTPPIVHFSLPDEWESTCCGKATISVSGTATDDTDLVSVKWENLNGYSGVCKGTNNWSSSNVVVTEGENLICVTAEDSAGNVGTASVLVTYNPDGPHIRITSPTSQAEYTTEQLLIDIAGNCNSDRDIASISWTTDRGFSGNCVGKSQWTATGVSLLVGLNAFRVTAKDSAGEVSMATLLVNVPDSEMPQVTIESPTPDMAGRRVGASIPVSGTASDNLGLRIVNWKTDRGHSGVCEGKDKWRIANLPLEYGANKLTITAVDTSDNATEASMVITRQQTDVAEAFYGLCMVSLPIIPDIENPKTALNFYGNSWASFSPESNDYLMFPDVSSYLLPKDKTPGRGFWAVFRGATQDPLGYATPLGQDVPIRLYPGWNLIGNPYNVDLPWKEDKILVRLRESSEWAPLSECEQILRNYAIGWQQDEIEPSTGEYYPIADVEEAGVKNHLAPWRGYWIKAFEECDILFPAPAAE